MENDKKNQAGRVVFTLLAGEGRAVWVDDVSPSELAAALEAGDEAVEPAAAEEYRRRFWYRLDGRATQRMLEVIERICA